MSRQRQRSKPTSPSALRCSNCQGQDQLIGQVLTHGNVALQVTSNLFDAPFGNEFSRSTFLTNARENFDDVSAFDFDDQSVAGAASLLKLVDGSAVVIPTTTVDHSAAFPFTDVPRQVTDDGSNAAADEGSTFHQVQPLKLLRRVDRDNSPSATRRVKARAFKSHSDSGPESLDQRRVRSLQKIERRRERVVRAAFQNHFRGTVSNHQCRQDGLQNKHRAAGSANAEVVISCNQFVGAERDLGRAERVAFHVGVANPGRRLKRRQVLAHQPRAGSLRTDLFDRDWLARNQRKGERRSNNLPAAFAL